MCSNRRCIGMKIGVCTQQINLRTHIAELCKRYEREKGMSYQILNFTYENQVLEYTKEPMQLLFFDIDLPGNYGIQIMKKLKNHDEVMRIIFVSNQEAVDWPILDQMVLDFGYNPIPYKQISRWLDIAFAEEKEDRLIRFDIKNKNKDLRISQVMYLESKGNYVKVVAKEKQFLARGTIKNWEEKLPINCMTRINDSYIINMNYIDEFGDKIKLKNQVKIPIGKVYKESVWEKYQDYILEKVGRRLPVYI